MTTYIRKPVRVEAFQFGAQPQPQWFIDMTHLGLAIEGMASFRCRKDARLLKVMDGDYIICWDDVLWVCEGDKFASLYQIPLGDEWVVVEMEPSPAERLAESAIFFLLTGGVITSVAIGALFGIGWGWLAAGLFSLVSGINQWFHRGKESVDADRDTGGA